MIHSAEEGSQAVERGHGRRSAHRLFESAADGALLVVTIEEMLQMSALAIVDSALREVRDLFHGGALGGRARLAKEGDSDPR